ncbi:type IV pilus modification protein PilV [Methylophaga sp.]|uniref:type IV pilus modification protein PilV n=1 Tax=Methylophaga sp. TaxID=2024840 RepID=UPI003F69A337
MLKKINTGFTLIEVLVALLVLAIGLLGLAYLHITSLKINQSAELRTLATNHVADVFEIMRADLNNARAGSYDLEISDDSPSGNSIIQRQLSSWMNRVSETLPGGDAAIDCTSFGSLSGTLCDVRIIWREIQDDGTLGITSFSYSAAL